MPVGGVDSRRAREYGLALERTDHLILVTDAMKRLLRALRNAFFSPGRRLFGFGFSRDYLRFALGASRNWGSVGPGSLKVGGFRVDYANQSHALFLLHEIFVNAEYEFQTPATQPHILDCGANIGMAVLFFKALHPAAEVLAFEADPLTFAHLTRTIESNRLTSVVAEQVAVTGEGAPVTLFRSRSDPASMTASVHQSWGGDEGEQVPAVRLSDRIAKTVDFLKLDIEGAEYGVVDDLVETGAIRWVREAVIEYHHLAGMPDAFNRMTNALRTAGFDVRIQSTDAAKPTGLIRARRTS